MSLAGNEKKIQALFRELKLADECAAPEFISVWNRAQATRPGSLPVFKISFAVATALFVITLSSVGLWSRNWRRSQPPNPRLASEWVKPGSTSALALTTPESALPGVAEVPNRFKSNRGDRKLAARRQTVLNPGNAAIRAPVSISSWQSPTAMLMESPADDVLTLLPQLDRSLTELKTFLPNTPQ